MHTALLLNKILGGLLAGIFLFGSCEEKDPCEDKVCENGFCNEGVCECFPGFYGTSCEFSENGGGCGNSDQYGYWQREDGQAWLDVSSAEVLICAPGVTDEVQQCTWNGTDKLKCTIFGEVSDWGLEKAGSQLKLIPITHAATNDPAYYNRDDEFCGNGSGETGKITFYIKSDLGCGNISVTVDGEGSKSITSYYTGGPSSCGASGCANFTLEPGQYTYSASCSGYTWEAQSFTITSDDCTLYELY